MTERVGLPPPRPLAVQKNKPQGNTELILREALGKFHKPWGPRPASPAPTASTSLAAAAGEGVAPSQRLTLAASPIPEQQNSVIETRHPSRTADWIETLVCHASHWSLQGLRGGSGVSFFGTPRPGMCLSTGLGGRGRVIWRTHPPRPYHPPTQNQKIFPLRKNETLNREPKLRGPF